MLIDDTPNKNLAVCVMYAILFINDMLCSCIFDTLELLKKSSYYEKKLKFRVRNLEKAVKHYNGFINKTRNADFIADMNDIFQEHIGRDSLIAQNSVINYLKKVKAPEPTLLGMVAMCDVLSTEAVNTVDDNIKAFAHIEPFIRNFTKLRVTDIQDALICMSHEFEDTLWRKEHYEIDLRNSGEIKNAFKIIRNKLNDPKFIFKVVETYDNIQ